MNKINIDKYTGCLIGGVAGDALICTVEFRRDMGINTIPEKYMFL